MCGIVAIVERDLTRPVSAADIERMAQLYQVSQVIHSTLEPQEALQLIIREAVRELYRRREIEYPVNYALRSSFAAGTFATRSTSSARVTFQRQRVINIGACNTAWTRTSRTELEWR